LSLEKPEHVSTASGASSADSQETALDASLSTVLSRQFRIFFFPIQQARWDEGVQSADVPVFSGRMGSFGRRRRDFVIWQLQREWAKLQRAGSQKSVAGMRGAVQVMLE
jgi:hypothetical protein